MAALLRERGVTAVPVVDDQDHVLGVVSGMDLALEPQPARRTPAARHKLAHRTRGRTARTATAAFLRDDEQIRRQLTHTLEMTWHLTWDQVAVTVHNGVVRLQGRVEWRGLAGELERLAAAVDGVTSVESMLTWDIDDTTAGAAVVRP